MARNSGPGKRRGRSDNSTSSTNFLTGATPQSTIVFSSSEARGSSLRDVLDANAASRAQACARFFDPAQKTRIGLEPIVEPIVFRFETDQHAGRFAMSGDDDLLCPGFPEITREVILDLGEWNFSHGRLRRFPSCASHDSASDFTTIAKISTVEPETS